MSPRGGKREDAGRPPIHGEKMTNTHVFITQEQKEKAKRIGEGEMAEGIRRALDAYIERSE